MCRKYVNLSLSVKFIVLCQRIPKKSLLHPNNEPDLQTFCVVFPQSHKELHLFLYDGRKTVCLSASEWGHTRVQGSAHALCSRQRARHFSERRWHNKVHGGNQVAALSLFGFLWKPWISKVWGCLQYKRESPRQLKLELLRSSAHEDTNSWTSRRWIWIKSAAKSSGAHIAPPIKAQQFP